MRRFEGCRQRIARAKDHREAIAKLWSDMVEEGKFYQPILGMDDDGTGSIWVKPAIGAGLPEIFSLQIGEMLYQLRAALDGCIYHASVLESGKNPPPDERKLEFPICNSQQEYAKKAAQTIDHLARKRRKIVEAAQPFNAPPLAPEDVVFNFNRTLRILNDWARKDRHRRLHVVGSWASNARPKVHCPAGTHLAYMRTAEPGLLEHENKVASFKLNGYSPDTKVTINPDLMIDIALDEIPPPCADNDTLGNRTRAMLMATRVIVRSFEESF